LGAGILGGLVLLVSRAQGETRTPLWPQDATSSSSATNNIGGTTVALTDEQKQMVALIQGAAEAALLNPAFMIALAVTESSLHSTVTGDDGKSLGLFQLTLPTVQYWNANATLGELLDPNFNTNWAMLTMQKMLTDYPGHSYGDYAEAWTLGASGRFKLGRRNPQKVQHMAQAVTDLGLTLNLNEVPA
jgi:hypothetical protein